MEIMVVEEGTALQCSNILEMLNSGMLLDHKLSLIKLLYTDERFKKLCDHDCIIKWCADILPTLSIEEELKVYNCLSVCLKSNSMSHLDGQGFLKTLLSCFMLPNIPEHKDLSSAVRGCLINIFHNPFFKEILKYNVKELSSCIEIYLVTFSFSGVSGCVKEIFSVIRSMYSTTLLKSSFIEEFVENILPNMITFIGHDQHYTQHIDSCFQHVLFPETESGTKYLQAFRNYKPDKAANSQYEYLIQLIVAKPFVCGSPMLSGKFYELFCKCFIACCKSHLIMTYEFVAFICPVVGCKPDIDIPLPVQANSYDKGSSLQCLKSVLVTVEASPQIVKTLNMGRSLFNDYLQALIKFVASQSNETCPEFYEFMCIIVKLIPSCSENVLRTALSVVLHKHKDRDELENYGKMLAEILKMYNKFYNMGKFVSHVFEEIVKALAFTKDVSNVEWENLFPKCFLLGQFENLAVVVLDTYQLCQTLDVVSHLLIECLKKIQTQDGTETCNLMLQFKILGYIWCTLFTNCELPPLTQSRPSIRGSKILESMDIAKMVLTRTGKLLLSDGHNTKLMNIFLGMSHLWGHMSYASDRVTSAGTDLSDLSVLCDFLSAQEWAYIVNTINETNDDVCHAKLSNLLLENLQCFPMASSLLKKGLVKTILNTTTVRWLWETNDSLLDHVTQKHLAKICERLVSQECINVPIEIKLKSVVKLSETRSVNFFLPVYVMKTAGMLLSADGRNLSASVSSFITNQYLLREFKGKYVSSCNSERKKIIKNIITMITDKIHEPVTGQYEKNTEDYLSDTLQIIQKLSAHSLDRRHRLILFLIFWALSKDLEKNKTLQNRVFNLMLDVLVGSCTCKNNLLGPCNNCCTFLQLPVDVAYASLLEWVFEQTKECTIHTDLIYYLCGTISRNTNLTERVVESVKSNMGLLWTFHKVLSKTSVSTIDETKNKKKRKKISNTSNCEIMQKCITYMTDCVTQCIVDGNLTPYVDKVAAYVIAVRRAIRIDDSRLDKLLQHWSEYWEVLRTDIKENPVSITTNEADFVSVILNNRNVFNPVLPENFIQQLWERLQSAEGSPARNNLVALCMCNSNVHEYEWIIEKLCKQFKTCDLVEVDDLAKLWSIAVQVHLPNEKLTILRNGVITACCDFKRLSKLLTSSDLPNSSQFKSTITFFMSAVARKGQIVITPATLDEMLEVVNDIRPQEHEAIVMALRLLTTLLLCKKALIVDRIPPFLQRFRSLVSMVAVASHVNERTPQNAWACYVTPAYYIERLSQLIVKNAEDFARLAPNLICHFVSCFEKYTLPSVIKMNYTNSVYKFLSICDKHGIEFIKRLMPEASVELFKTLYNNYVKFQKFTGNV